MGEIIGITFLRFIVRFREAKSQIQVKEGGIQTQEGKSQWRELPGWPYILCFRNHSRHWRQREKTEPQLLTHWSIKSDENKEKQTGRGCPEKMIFDWLSQEAIRTADAKVWRCERDGSPGGHSGGLAIGWEEAVAGVGTGRLAEVHSWGVLRAMEGGLEFTLQSGALLLVLHNRIRLVF